MYSSRRGTGISPSLCVNSQIPVCMRVYTYIADNSKKNVISVLYASLKEHKRSRESIVLSRGYNHAVVVCTIRQQLPVNRTRIIDMQRNSNVPWYKSARLKSRQRRLSKKRTCNVKRRCGNIRAKSKILLDGNNSMRRFILRSQDWKYRGSIDRRFLPRCVYSRVRRVMSRMVLPISHKRWILTFNVKLLNEYTWHSVSLNFLYRQSVTFPRFIRVRVNFKDATDRHMHLARCTYTHTRTKRIRYVFSRNKSLKLLLFPVFNFSCYPNFGEDQDCNINRASSALIYLIVPLIFSIVAF